ncbi:MAG TPA: hypothetical protein VMQ46_10120 [Acidimicrobiia bacterium]|nr:hypothetical protein [Acidimicrobiia bacterium]
MGTTVTGSAATTQWRTILLALVAVGLACAPWSWVVDGVTPSWVVYPVVLLVGLWRIARGGGALYLGVAATIFLLVHVPWTSTAFIGQRINPLPADIAVHHVEWTVTLFIVPLLTAFTGFAARWQTRTSKSTQPPLGAERGLP